MYKKNLQDEKFDEWSIILTSGIIWLVDVDNRLKDVMDALQARWGSKITKNNFASLITNDNIIYKVTVEKKLPPKQSKGLGHLIIQRMK